MAVIRPARHQDAFAIADIEERAYLRSRYASISGFRKDLSRSMASQAVQRSGLQSAGGACCFVSEAEGGAVNGFIIGIIQPLYLLGDKLETQDMGFVVEPDAGSMVAPMLVGAYRKWAQSCPDVVSIKMSATDVVQEFDRFGVLMRRTGFKPCGAIYEWRTEQ